jgi:type I restriction enzyme S subunit
MTMHEGLVDQRAKFKKRVASADVSDYKVIRRGQLVVGFPIDEGVLDFQTLYDEGIVSPAYGVWDVSDESRVYAPYLKKFLRSGHAMAYYKGKLRGSTARRRSLPVEVFLALPVPLPPLDEQRRIAAILDRADAVRAKRRQVVAHLDALTQSIFHDMFGDVAAKASLRSMGVDFVSGKNVLGGNLDAHPYNKVIKVSAISGGHFIPGESKPMPADYEPPAAHRLRKGDILFGRASGSLDLLGATAVVDVEPDSLFLPDKVWRLAIQAGALVEDSFILGVLRSRDARSYIRHNVSGAAGVHNISKAKLLEYVAPLPNTDLQRAFAERVDRVDPQRAAVRRALEADDELFASLQSRAFRREL